jgi:hypothetical protein
VSGGGAGGNIIKFTFLGLFFLAVFTTVIPPHIPALDITGGIIIGATGSVTAIAWMN